ncbi:Uncharacterised protein [Mycobacterium tuberculosis]|nr:Uncharacterised protein [Mycobacterium tuberculosis]
MTDDLCHRHTFDPLLDHHLRCACHDVRHLEARVVVVRLGEGALVGGLQPVVEFHFGAFNQFVDHPLDVGAG